MLERLKAVLEEYVEINEFTPEMGIYTDLKITSFDMISILLDIEDEFGVTIKDRDSSKFFHVSDVMKYLEKNATK